MLGGVEPDWRRTNIPLWDMWK